MNGAIPISGRISGFLSVPSLKSFLRKPRFLRSRAIYFTRLALVRAVHFARMLSLIKIKINKVVIFLSPAVFTSPGHWFHGTSVLWRVAFT
jgi:hypothetical protein